MKKRILVLVLLVALTGLQGCSYLRSRGNDICDIVDLGLTFSGKPHFAAYVNAPFVELFPIGIGEVDGRFVGIGDGGGRLGSPHYESSFGLLLWGYEERTFKYGWDELEAMTEEQRERTLRPHHVGVIGTIQDLAQGPPPPTPRDFFSCPHYLHLGFIGIVGTAYYWEMLDAVIGFTGIDISRDDRRWEQPQP